MNQNYYIILLPTILLIGTLTIYRSYNSINSISIQEHKKDLIIPLNNRVNIEFFVMSKCPDAIKCERLFLPSLLKLSSIINFTLSFIGKESPSHQFLCSHGHTECIANKQQLCIQNMYSQTKFIKYLLCQSKDLFNIPYNGEQCAKENSINWSKIENCVNSNRSNVLFHKSLERTRLALAQRSCTIHMNGQFWCMHDGYWYNCKEDLKEKIH